MHGGTRRHQKPFSAVHGGVMWLTLVNFRSTPRDTNKMRVLICGPLSRRKLAS
jgi:hypothetical protein